MRNKVGSSLWFQNRARASISKISQGVWDYSESAVLYTPDVSTAYEEAQKDEVSGNYKKAITDEESSFIQNIAPDVVRALPHNFAYIDLGPGTEHKEQFFQNSILEQQKNILYVPVDISERMLSIANEYAKRRGFETRPFHQTFEDLHRDLKKLPDLYRFVSLGLTFTNYKPKEILQMMKTIMGKKGSLFITVQIRERVDISEIQKAYREVIVPKMLPGKLRLVGVNFERDVSNIEVTEAVEIYVTLKNISEDLKTLGVKKGDKLLLLRSYRYGLEQIKKILIDYEVEYYDKDAPFLGCLIK